MIAFICLFGSMAVCMAVYVTVHMAVYVMRVCQTRFDTPPVRFLSICGVGDYLRRPNALMIAR